MSNESTDKATQTDEVQVAYLRNLFENARWVELGVKWLLLVVGVLSTGVLTAYRSSTWLAIGILSYAISNVLLTYRLVTETVPRGSEVRIICLLSCVVDTLFASLVIYYGGGVGSDMYLIYALLALKNALYYPAWHEVIIFSIFACPLYVVVLYFSLGSWYFLLQAFFLLRYLLLFALVLVSLMLGWIGEYDRQREARLRQDLADRTLDLDQKTGSMQQMAASLGNRVQELRTLQEGIKAINSALALDDVLRLIVTNAAHVLEGARCSVALLDEQRDHIVSMAASDEQAHTQAEVGSTLDRDIAAWVVLQGKPLLSDATDDAGPLPKLWDVSVRSVIGVPLALGGQPIGALIATSAGPKAFTTEDLNLLNAFADQAAAAVKNARLYEQLAQEQRHTEQLYAHVEERRNELEAILRGIGDGVIVTDPELNLLLMNPVATRIFRVKPDVTSSKPLCDVIPHVELHSLFQDALQGEDQAIVREIALPSGGERSQTIYQALTSPVLSADGHTRGVVTVLRDITSQKELERMKSNFLSVVSHELKTPLHSIKGFVDIILMGKTGTLNETQLDFLGTVRDQTAHLQNLINDLLEFSRLESGQVKLRLAEISLAEVATAVVDKFKLVADQAQVRLVQQVSSDLPSVEADRMRIEQVLSNLVDNAIKFTPASGSVTVHALDLGNEVQVSVSDTGIGIQPAELERIFDRFYQVDSGSTRPYRGTGLGLTICKHIVEYHHGRIWAESQEGQGSTFHFILPKHIANEDDQLLLDFLSLPDSRAPLVNKNHL